MRPVWERVLPGALVLFVSDGFDDELTALALRLAAAKRDVLLIQILSAAERDFPFKDGHRFLDPETNAEIRVDAKAARKEYLERFSAARAELAQRLDAAGVRHAEQLLDQPLDTSLRQVFAAWTRASR
jgi:uncharacterized protein (DUF58 family)